MVMAFSDVGSSKALVDSTPTLQPLSAVTNSFSSSSAEVIPLPSFLPYWKPVDQVTEQDHPQSVSIDLAMEESTRPKPVQQPDFAWTPRQM